MKPFRSLQTIVLLLFLSTGLTACSSTSEWAAKLNPFKIDVRQGNYVTQEMVAQLKPGQTRDQVRFVLGTPLIVDAFHSDRWDYVYHFKPGRGPAQQRRLVVFFDGDKLVRVAGDVVAGEAADSVEAKPAVSTLEIEDPAAIKAKAGAK